MREGSVAERINPNAYRYQYLWCDRCREVTIHRQRQPFSQARDIRFWSKMTYACGCGKSRVANAFMGMGDGKTTQSTQRKVARK